MTPTTQSPEAFAERLRAGGLGTIYDKVLAGQRLDADEGMRLFASNDILSIGHMANIVRERINGDTTYYVSNRHLNYTNVCVFHCTFCAFRADRGAADAWEWDVDEVVRRAGEAAGQGAREVHIVGGVHPSLPFSYYTDLLKALRDTYPQLDIKAFTAVELKHLAKLSHKPLPEALRELKDAGLTSIPGGGAEIFEPRIRKEICDEKLDGNEWLDVMRTAHGVGIRSNATMLYGHVEDDAARVGHLLALRALQDETGGFMCFIPLAFHPENTGMSDLPDTAGMFDLKVIAISRLLLDNFDHIKAYWTMIGLKLAQVAQSFGADDLDGTILDERITHAAGAKTPVGVTRNVLENLIREAGRVPVERDSTYNPA